MLTNGRQIFKYIKLGRKMLNFFQGGSLYKKFENRCFRPLTIRFHDIFTRRFSPIPPVQ